MLAMKIYFGGHKLEISPVSSGNIELSKDGESIIVKERTVKTYRQNEKTIFS